MHLAHAALMEVETPAMFKCRELGVGANQTDTTEAEEQTCLISLFRCLHGFLLISPGVGYSLTDPTIPSIIYCHSSTISIVHHSTHYPNELKCGRSEALLWEPNAPELRSLRRQLAPNARAAAIISAVAFGSHSRRIPARTHLGQ